MPAKKPKQPKAKKITLAKRAEWEKILDEVDKNEIPVTVLQSLRVNLVDETVVEIDIKSLIDGGLKPEEIQHRLNTKLDELDSYIVDVDFFIDIDSVAKTVQSFTDKLLKNI